MKRIKTTATEYLKYTDDQNKVDLACQNLRNFSFFSNRDYERLEDKQNQINPESSNNKDISKLTNDNNSRYRYKKE